MSSLNFYLSLIVTLTILLVFLTFYLVMKEKTKIRLNLQRLNLFYFVILFFVIVFMLLIMIENYRTPVTSITNQQGYKLVIKSNEARKNISDTKNIDFDKFYVDKDHRFLLSLPDEEGWALPLRSSGLIAYLERTGLETRKENIESFFEWNPYTELLRCFFSELKLKSYNDIMKGLNNSLNWSAYGSMFRTSYTVQVKQRKKTELLVKKINLKPVAAFPDEKTDTSQTADSTASLPPPPKADPPLAENGGEFPPLAEGENDTDAYTSIRFVNYFSITTFDKSQLSQANSGSVALLNYFMNNTANVYTNIEKIFARENDVVIASSIHFTHAVMNGKTGAFSVHRWFRVIEEPTHIFMLEISYSPQTDPDGVCWNQLKKIFESVNLISVSL